MIHTIDRFDNINFKGDNYSSDGGSVFMTAFIAICRLLDDFLNLLFVIQKRAPSIQTQIFWLN